MRLLKDKIYCPKCNKASRWLPCSSCNSNDLFNDDEDYITTEYGATVGAPKESSGSNFLKEVETIYFDHLGCKIDYDRTQIIETEQWMFVPIGYVGSIGIVVDKEPLQINVLGSGFPRELCLWAHCRSIKGGVYDLVIDSISNFEMTLQIAYNLGMHNKINPVGNHPETTADKPRWYSEEEVKSILSDDTPRFRSIYLGYNYWNLRATDDGSYFKWHIEEPT